MCFLLLITQKKTSLLQSSRFVIALVRKGTIQQICYSPCEEGKGCKCSKAQNLMGFFSPNFLYYKIPSQTFLSDSTIYLGMTFIFSNIEAGGSPCFVHCLYKSYEWYRLLKDQFPKLLYFFPHQYVNFSINNYRDII